LSSPRILVERLTQFLKFCIVGGTGLFVDMAFLYLLADPSQLGLDITLSKLCAAQAAICPPFFSALTLPIRQRSPMVGYGRTLFAANCRLSRIPLT